MHGLSCAETAAVLGTPVGTVKWRLHEAHARVRAGLEDGRALPGGIPERDPLPPRLAGRGGVGPGVAVLPGGWPPRLLELPAGEAVRFAVASRVRGQAPAFWVGGRRTHHLWWPDGTGVLRVSGDSVGAVRALAEATGSG